MRKFRIKWKKPQRERKSHRESERAFGKREKQLLSSVKSHRYTQTERERERRRENKRDDVYDESQHHHKSQSLPAKTQRARQKAVEETPTNDQQEDDTNDEYKSDGEERRKERLEQRRTGRVRVSQEVRFYSFFFCCDFFSEMRLRDKMRSFPPKPPCDAFEATREDDASICLFVCS